MNKEKLLERQAFENNIQSTINKYKDKDKKLFKPELKTDLYLMIDAYKRMRQARDELRVDYRMAKVQRDDLLIENNELKGGKGNIEVDIHQRNNCRECGKKLFNYFNADDELILRCPQCQRAYW
ncbi:hypothetical protein CWR48_13980 [Oceanobacillus arenosus]|uniref:Uncharacterized protein n=1 Tax=Oceanobacillus arenosus TaxID=1229153 RepID=A0A3D8PNC9_9BACI|nr:hypothetical protein [Oceanobacillus arenosus]RDW17620.1 hypothetical protein CWR48_13980 [Oceanobacillus arenosus]